MVVECAGQPMTAQLAGKLTRTRGRLIVMGVFEKPAPLDLTDLVFREKTVSGSMSGYGLYNETIRMMTDKRFKGQELITGRISLDDLVEKGYHGLLYEKETQREDARFAALGLIRSRSAARTASRAAWCRYASRRLVSHRSR